MLTTTPSVAKTTLPADFYKLRSLVWLQSTDNPVEVRRATLNDYVLDSLLTARSWQGMQPAYRFEGASSVRWLPMPSLAYSVTCVYVQAPATLTADADTIDAGPGWEEWIVNDVCVHIAQIREEDPSGYAAERQDCEGRIRSQAPDRDPFASKQVCDTRGAVNSRARGLWQSNGRFYGRWG